MRIKGNKLGCLMVREPMSLIILIVYIALSGYVSEAIRWPVGLILLGCVLVSASQKSNTSHTNSI